LGAALPTYKPLCRIGFMLTIVAGLAACGRRVEIAGTTGSVHLRYRCGAFTPQVESREQIEALVETARPVIVDAQTRGQLAFAVSLRSALIRRDFREAEKFLVDYLCSRP
jgi:hypothetical protein